MTSQIKTKKPSILPVVLLGGLAFALTLFFLNTVRAETAVVVAKRALPVGARLTAADVEIVQVRNLDKREDALTDIAAVEGQVLSVQRMPGDQITASMLGAEAISAISASLAPDHRAVAVQVSRSSGLAGIVRPGDYVSLVAVVKPDAGGVNFFAEPGLPGTPAAPSVPVSGTASVRQPTPTAIPTSVKPQTAFARVTATGLKVLLVPQTFRYEEASTDGGGYSQAWTSVEGQDRSVILLDVPIAPVTVAGGKESLQLSLPELIALLDTYAEVYLVLEPQEGATAGRYPGVAIEQLVDAGVGG